MCLLLGCENFIQLPVQSWDVLWPLDLLEEAERAVQDPCGQAGRFSVTQLELPAPVLLAGFYCHLQALSGQTLVRLEGIGHLGNWAPPPEFLIPFWEGARECAFQTSSQVKPMLLVCGHHLFLHWDSPWVGYEAGLASLRCSCLCGGQNQYHQGCTWKHRPGVLSSQIRICWCFLFFLAEEN